MLVGFSNPDGIGSCFQGIRCAALRDSSLRHPLLFANSILMKLKFCQIFKVSILILLLLFVAGCRDDEYERRYNELVSQNSSMRSQLESKIRSLEAELRSEQNSGTQHSQRVVELDGHISDLNNDILAYQRIFNFIQRGEVDAAIAHYRELKFAVVDEFDQKLIEYMADIDRLRSLDNLASYLDPPRDEVISRRVRLALSILGSVAIFSLIFFIMAALSASLCHLIMQIQERELRYASIVVSFVIILLYIGSFSITGTPLTSLLFGAISSVDIDGAISNVNMPSWAPELLSISIPIVVGVLAAHAVSKVMEGHDDVSGIGFSVVVALSLVYSIDTAINYLTPNEENLYLQNALFVVSLVFSTVLALVKKHRPEKNPRDKNLNE